MSLEDVAILTPTQRSALFYLLAADTRVGAVGTVLITEDIAVTTMVGAWSSHPRPAVLPVISTVVANLAEGQGNAVVGMCNSLLLH
jgi:hypothetical protein